MILASAPVNEIVHIEGNYYFNPEHCKTDAMEISGRKYNCPSKGVCNWIDLKTETGYINDIAWVYPDTKPGYEKIRGRYGFFGKFNLYDYLESDN